MQKHFRIWFRSIATNYGLKYWMSISSRHSQGSSSIISINKCWPYQTAKLVLQQLGGSGQWSLRGQRLKRLDAVSWRVSGTHWITAHTNVCKERKNINTPDLVSGTSHTLTSTSPSLIKQPLHASWNSHTLHMFWLNLYFNLYLLTCSHFIQSYETAQHLWEVQS